MRYFSHVPNFKTGKRHTLNNPPFTFGQDEYLVEEISEEEFQRRNTPEGSLKWIVYSRLKPHDAGMRHIIVNPNFNSNKPNLMLLL